MSSVLAKKFSLPDETRLETPILRVKDIDRMLDFYQGMLGLQVSRKTRTSDLVELGFRNREKLVGAADTLLTLKHDPEAGEAKHDSAGLYHFAILVPERKSLANAFLRIQERKVQFDGFADHLVSEALYLHDPERNGIEIYRDRPRSGWPRNKDGDVLMDTLALDLEDMLSELPDDVQTSDAFPNGARIGHLHLRVTDLERSVKFYHDRLGFDISGDLASMGAMFLSAGGYHHHIGLNTWHSKDGKRHASGAKGLDRFTIALPRDDSTMYRLETQLEGSNYTRTGERELLVTDPDGIEIAIRVSA
jgi:catechol 2,3-dioxygenase